MRSFPRGYAYDDYHKPLPTHDPRWGVIVTGLVLISWACCFVALHWALT